MALFGRRPAAAQAAIRRTIPRLNPAFYQEIHRSIQSWDGTDSLPEVITGINNAISNVGERILTQLGEGRRLPEFRRFGARLSDAAIGDAMIDFLIRAEPTAEEPLQALLKRLRETYSHPPT